MTSVTVAVVVKVFDGIILAADSATTLSIPVAGGGAIHQVYNSANKVFHLHRSLPVAAMTWGLGAIESASIATLTKDLRRRLMGNDPDHADWSLNPDAYTIEEVAERYVEMFHGELYSTSFGGASGVPELGMLIAGYSSGEKQAEAWQVLIDDPATPPTPEMLIGVPGYGYQAFAQPDATERLFSGIDPGLRDAIRSAVGEPTWSAKVEHLVNQAGRLPLAAPMPIADAIEFAKFLVQTTAQYSHFLMGPDTVGGVIDVAAISRHEGFRWINRKHYYPQDLNPWGTNHDH